MCQKETFSVADAANLWLDLQVPAEFKNKLKHRQEMALNIYALSACYFHPQFDNLKLSYDQKSQINSFLLHHFNSECLAEWDKFNTNSGIFKILKEKNVTNPFIYWRMAKMEYPVISNLALKLLKIPASSA